MTLFSRDPVYRQLFEKLKSDINQGRLGSCGDLLSARSVARTYGLSRDTVNRAIAELLAHGYIEKVAGRGFMLKPLPQQSLCRQIGIVTTYARPSTDGFYGAIFRQIERAARTEGFLVTWLCADEHGAIDVSYLINLYEKNRVDGFVFVAVENTHLINRFVERGIPVVSADYTDSSLACDSVALDNYQGCRSVVDRLVSEGWDRFSIVVRDDPKDYPSKERLAGFCQALAACGVKDEHTRKFHLQEANPAITGNATSSIMAQRYLSIAEASGDRTVFLSAYAYHATHLLWAATTRFPKGRFAAGVFGCIENGLSYGHPVFSLAADTERMGKCAATMIIHRILDRQSGPVTAEMIPMRLLSSD